MAKNLSELPERTASAGTDLIHVNTGSTSGDYKQTKENFLGSLLTNAFMAATTATSSLTDANDHTLHGMYWVQGSICANLPSTSSGFYAYLLCMGRAQICIQHSGNDNVASVYVRNYTNSQWYGWRRITLGTVENPTYTLGQGVTGSMSIIASGNVVVVTLQLRLAAGTYTGQTQVLATISHKPMTAAVRALVTVNGTPTDIMLKTSDGTLVFNTDVTVTGNPYVLGQIVYVTNMMS